ncbi:DUF1405 domain-containing protein [Halonotius terrestris]|uniref:DUF1405 domain-containing protein n=1 Tax=Halonotius terrestris TaxID=2487750 RepID=A0A8J8TD94_9EURY|nr:DUF1405 domain-containing protein [Halonotius terrestris]TQQ83291.1 DUF1405 domain-containing protein [Halonotius terrestris]
MSQADEPETTPTLRRPVPEATAESYLSHGPSLIMVLVANAVTFLLGVRFYVDTMPAVPTLLWPLYADSPTAIALATLSVATLLPILDRPLSETPVNRPLAYLHTLAFVWLVKYGLWVAIALNRRPSLYFGFDANALYAYWGIIGSHLLFVGFAFAILHYGRTTRGALGLALGLLLANDIVDYGFGYHPPLRYEPGVVVPTLTVVLSILAVGLAAWQFDRLGTESSG